MKPQRKKKIKDEIEELEDDQDKRPVRFEALEELTNSEVVKELKAGLSRISPIELEIEEPEQDDDAPQSY